MKNFQNKAKIARVSKIIRNFLFAGLVLWIIAVPATLFPLVTLWNLQTAHLRYLQFGPPLLGVSRLIVNLKLFRFFDRLKNGHLFDAKTVGNLDGAGRWCVALWFFQGLYCEIGRDFFQMTNAWDFGGSSSGFFVAGLTLIFVAWLLKEAQELQEEQELTV